MKGLAKFNPTYRTLFEEMCKVVNVDPETIDFKEKQWYLSYEWTRSQEQQYKKWFIDYIMGDKERLRNLKGNIFKRSKKHIEKMADEFLLCYGWRTV